MTYLERLSDAVERSMLAGIDPKQGSLEQAMHYALSIRGKRLRPLLFLTLLDGSGVNALEQVEVAAAIEIIHTYSLIHDDLPCMDNDDLRRGFPTVHRKFNEALALLAGDTLLTLAFEKIVSAPVPAETAVAIMRTITYSIGHEGMAGGQALDLDFSGDPSLVETIHRRKTAELIRATLLSAGYVAGYDKQKLDTLSAAALAIGLGFQLADDLLDVSGDENVVGKKLHKDRKSHRPNAALYFGAQAVGERIDRLYDEAQKGIRQLGITHEPFLELMKKMVYRSR